MVVARANQLDFFPITLAELSVLFVHDGKLTGYDALQLVHDFVGRATALEAKYVASHCELVVVARANQLYFLSIPLAELSVLDVHECKITGYDALQLVHELVGRATALEAKYVASHCELVVVARANQLDFFVKSLAKLSVLFVHNRKLAGYNALQLVHELVGRAMTSTELVTSHGELVVVGYAHERHHAALVLSDKHQFALHDLIRLVVANLGVRFDRTVVTIGFAFERH
jgi:hypothetical protein